MKCLTFATKIYTKEEEFTFFYADKKTDLEVGIITLSDKLIISFRGTESLKDIIYDMMFRKIETDYGRIHIGFYHQLYDADVYHEFFNKVIELIEGYDDIYVTGHSLGGALATLFGYNISLKTTKHINVISFASPRVGDWKWYKRFISQVNLSHKRVVVSSDPIPLFPFINYFHVGETINLKSNSWLYRTAHHGAIFYHGLLKKVQSLKLNGVEPVLKSS